MTIDLKAIRQAAEAATPGPWEAAGPSFGAPLPKYLNCVGLVTEDDEFEDVCTAPFGSDGGNSADMAYIATANPATVIALCNEIERLTACLKKANDQAEHFEREWYLRGDRLEAAEKTLAEPVVEPVGYASIEDLRQLQYCNGTRVWCESLSMWGPKEEAPPAPPNLIAIYTAPPPAEVPLLTDDAIRRVADKADEGQEPTEFMLAFARAIEQLVRRKAGLA